MQISTSSSTESLRVRDGPSHRLPAIVWHAPWSLSWARIIRVVVLLSADMVALLLAASLGYLCWAKPMLDQPLSIYAELVPLLLSLAPLNYAAAGLYRGFGIGVVETLRRIACCTSLAFLVLASVTFALKLPSHYSRMSLAIAWGASLVVVPSLRFLVFAVVKRWVWWGEPAVLIGRGQWAQETIRALRNALSLGYRPMWVLSPNPSWHGRLVEGVPVLGGPELAPYLAERGIRVALVSDSREDSRGSLLSWFQQHFRHVVMIQEAQDLPVEQVRICNLGNMFGIEFTNNLLHWYNRLLKRIMDLILGAFFLTLALPLITLGGLAVKLASHGSFFFYQRREGVRGHLIKVWKLRTMYEDAEDRLESYLSTDPALRREWQTRFKLAHDPRIIPWVGPFLRRFSLDELPQLWSVIKGEMSLVGPRPFPEYHLQQFPSQFRELRRRVRPGLTGLWQVIIRSDGDIEAQQMYDTYYIRNWSVWLDVWILFRTVRAVLLSKGAR